MANKQTNTGIKPSWLYDKQGNIKTLHLPVNGKGEVITLNPAKMNGKIPNSVGFGGVIGKNKK